MKLTPDYRSRFRILKGGKISLVVSALLVGSSVIVPAAHATGMVSQTLSADTTINVDSPITATDENGLLVDGASWTATINNNSTITSSGSAGGSLSGINAYHLGSGSIITNTVTHTIEVTNDAGDAFGITTKSGGFYGHLINVSSIVNNGTITVGSTASNRYAEGIYVGGDMILSSLSNTGAISATNNNSYAIGIDASGVVQGSSITNSGTIGADGIVAQGIYAGSLVNDSGTQSLILNDTAGQINVIADKFAAGIQVYGSPYIIGIGQKYTMLNSKIENKGTISTTLNISSGNLELDAYGIFVYPDDYQIKNSQIINSGSIDVVVDLNTHDPIYGTLNATGIKVAYAQSDALTITNSGTISVDVNNNSYSGLNNLDGSFAAGIEVKGGSHNALTITNDAEGGQIIVDSDSSMASGIRMYTDALNKDATITNAGTISVTNTGNAYGIMIDTDTDVNNLAGAQVSNSSTIDVYSSSTGNNTGSIGIAVEVMSSWYDNAGTTESTRPSFIHNTGTIIAGGASYGIGIATMAMVGDATITNSATIRANGGNYAIGIGAQDMIATPDSYVVEDATTVLAPSITNSGTINVNGGDAAFGIMAGNRNSVTVGETTLAPSITNSGTINVNGGVEANMVAGMMLENSDVHATVTNSGTITATLGGTMDEDGVITGGEMSAGAFSIFSGGSGTLNNTGKMYGQMKYMGTVNNHGTISLPYNANSNTMPSMVGDFNNKSTGILEIGLFSEGIVEDDVPVFEHSQLYTQNATFESGSTIKVNVLSASGHQAMLAGQRMNDVVVAENTLTVNGTLNITDNSALLNFELIRDADSVNDGHTIDLNIVQGTTIFDSTVAGGGNTNAQSAANTLQVINDDLSNHPAMSGYIDALNHLGSDAEVAHAVASTTPIAANASVTANTQIMNGVQGIVEMRQNSVMGGSMNSGDMSLSDKNLWVKLYGSKGTQDNKDGINGFDVKAYGLGFGADAEISPRQRIGAAFFYTDAKVDVNDMPQTSKLKVYTAMLYGNVPMNANTDFLYQAGYTWQKTESERTILPTYDHAKADYTATTASLDLKVMQTYKMNEAMDVRPLIEGTYRYFTNPSYSESGAGAMSLQTDKFTSSQLITSAGAIIDYKLDKTSKLVTDLRLGYDWHHDSQAVSASYEGASGVSFTTRGIDNGGWQYDIGVGYETTKVLGGELNFMYNYQGQGSSFDNHVVSAKYVYKF